MASNQRKQAIRATALAWFQCDTSAAGFTVRQAHADASFIKTDDLASLTSGGGISLATSTTTTAVTSATGQ